MKITQRAERELSVNDPGCMIYEHPYEKDAPMNVADIILEGRYPEVEGEWVQNTAVDAMIMVVKGRGRLLSPTEDPVSITPHTSIAIPRGEFYALEGSNLHVTYTSTPPWTPGQAKYEKL
jgi:hypothetical protein